MDCFTKLPWVLSLFELHTSIESVILCLKAFSETTEVPMDKIGF